ncbi:hypothetical protein C2857_000766 [Epichloe festucae Fl1]|uniref:Uncharacterized protein n=1 Tax=Epichloe festucae (strain Fl1) TaxID=877507 RepID=A0A7U3Q183_EPIFF|nr:hypothetical protein C2857_000766 [Epichloe festucae Fl1]
MASEQLPSKSILPSKQMKNFEKPWLTRVWLNGARIGRTPNFNLAGKFSISKWPCAKYCLGGFTAGSTSDPGQGQVPTMTFYSQDPRMCVAFDFAEVLCDIKNGINDCIWKSRDQCCDKTDCTKTGKGEVTPHGLSSIL